MTNIEALDPQIMSILSAIAIRLEAKGLRKDLCFRLLGAHLLGASGQGEPRICLNLL
jgi:hypothetical protein